MVRQVNFAQMFTHLPPKERTVYVAIISIFLFGAGYVGAQRLRQPARVEVDIPKDLKLAKPLTAFTEMPGSQDVVVDVVGAVRSPGLKHLPAGSRIDDAVKAAGGATDIAELDSINLAARVEDGQQIDVPVRMDPTHPTIVNAPEPAHESDKAEKHPARPINLSSASSDELQELPGVGPATADKLIRYRQEHGKLSLEDLRAIPGLGPKRIEKIKPWVR